MARYARFADYHEVLGERLTALSAFIASLAPQARSLWYVDTGPFLERDLAERIGDVGGEIALEQVEHRHVDGHADVDALPPPAAATAA